MSGRAGRKWNQFSPAEKAWVRANATRVASDLHSAFCAEFGRDDVSKNVLTGMRKRNGWRTGRDGRWEPGSAPSNKGKKGIGTHQNCRATQFKKGLRYGLAKQLYVPIGTERMTDGYLSRKTNDDLPLQSRWRYVHLINWELQNGPLPDGHCLKCLDGNRLNVCASNWEAIPRALLPLLIGGNGKGKRRIAYDAAPAELKPAIMAVAKLTNAISKRTVAP